MGRGGGLTPGTPWLAGALAAASAALHLRAEYRGPRWQVYLFKPFTTAVLLALAVAGGTFGTRYGTAIAVGLGFSLAGDVFLMLPGDRFVAGLASFLAAHLAYLVAFTSGVPAGTAPLLLVPFLAAGLVMLSLLWPRLGRLRLPVVVYVAVIVAMAGQATGRAWTLHTPSAQLAAAGAALFVVSDAVLAFNRFHTPFRSAQAVVMSSYVAAQWLIALSAVAR